MKGKTESTSSRCTAGVRLFHFNDFSHFKLTVRGLCSDKRRCSDVESVSLRDRHYTCHCKMPQQHIAVISLTNYEQSLTQAGPPRKSHSGPK